MSLYAIGDFHLSFTVNKPMDVFDKRWKPPSYFMFVYSVIYILLG